MMANEVHDSLAQELTYMRMRMSLLRDAIRDGDEARAFKYWSDVDSSLTNAHRRLRELITYFRSRMDPQGLLHALQEMTETFLERTGVALEFANRVGELDLPVAREVQVFHIVQEALANVCKHANARRARLTLRMQGKRLRDRGRRRRRRHDRRPGRRRCWPLRHRDHARTGVPSRRRARPRQCPGGGTRVRLYFPAMEPQTEAAVSAAGPSQARTAPPPAGRAAANAASVGRPVSEPISVVLIDDHGLCRRGLAELLEQRAGIKVLGTTGSADEAVRLLREGRPDLVVMDLRMAPVDGFTLLARIRAEGIDTPVVVLTMSDLKDDLARAFRAGVRGYLLKDMDPDDVIDAIRRIARGEVVVAPLMAGKLVDLLVPGKEGKTRDDYLRQLTEREREILQHLSSGKSNKAIAQALDISHDTVKLHVRHILSKLGLTSRVEAAVFAVEHRVSMEGGGPQRA